MKNLVEAFLVAVTTSALLGVLTGNLEAALIGGICAALLYGAFSYRGKGDGGE